MRWRAIILLSDCSGKVLTNRAVCVRVVPSVRKPTKEMTAIFSQMESAAGSWCGNRWLRLSEAITVVQVRFFGKMQGAVKPEVSWRSLVLWQWISGQQSSCFLNPVTVTVVRFMRYANELAACNLEESSHAADWQVLQRRGSPIEGTRFDA